MGLSTDDAVRPVSGRVRRGAASELTTQSTGGKSRRSVSTTISLVRAAKASPLKHADCSPRSPAAASKAAVLYHPAVPARRAFGGRSKKTPKVAAPPPKASAMREPRP